MDKNRNKKEDYCKVRIIKKSGNVKLKKMLNIIYKSLNKTIL